MEFKCPNDKPALFICNTSDCTALGLKCKGCNKCDNSHSSCPTQQNIQKLKNKLKYVNENAKNQKDKIVKKLKNLKDDVQKNIKMIQQLDVSKFGVPQWISQFQQPKSLPKKKGRDFSTFLAAESSFTIQDNFSPEILNQIQYIHLNFEKFSANFWEYINIDTQYARIKAQASIFQKKMKNKSKQQSYDILKKYLQTTIPKIFQIIKRKKQLSLKLCNKSSIDNKKLIIFIQKISKQTVMLLVLSIKTKNYKSAIDQQKLIQSLSNKQQLEQFAIPIDQATQQTINKHMAVAYKQLNKPKQSLDYYQRILPKDYQLLKIMYQLYEKIKKGQNIFLDQLYKSKKDDPFALLKKTQYSQKYYQFDQAARYFGQYLKYAKNAKTTQNFSRMTNYLIKIQNYQQAVEYLLKIFQLDQTKIDKLYQSLQIRKYILKDISSNKLIQNYRNILKVSKKLIQSKNLSKQLVIYVIKTYNDLSKLLKDDQIIQKIQLLNQASQLQTKYSIVSLETHQSLAQLYGKQKKYGPAIVQLDKCLAKYSKPQHYFCKAKFILDWNQSKLKHLEAQALLTDAIKSREHFSDAFFLRGKCRLALRKVQDALKDFIIAKDLKIIPGDNFEKVPYQIFYSIAKCYNYLGNNQKQLQNYEIVLNKDQRNIHARFGKALILKKQKKFPQACSILESLIKQNSPYELISLSYCGDIYQQIADDEQNMLLHQRQKHYNKAKKFHQDAYLFEKNDQTVQNYCRILNKLGQNFKSHDVLEKYKDQKRLKMQIQQ